MKSLCRFFSFVLVFCLAASAVHAEPKTEFGRIETAFATLQTRLDGLGSKDKAKATSAPQVIASAGDLQKLISKYSLKETDRSYILEPLTALNAALKRYSAAPANSKGDGLRAKSLPAIKKWQGYFAKYPVLKILAADSKIRLANTALLNAKYAQAEDLYNAAKVDLDSARKQQIKVPAVASALTSVADQIDTLLLYTRREEAPGKSFVKSATDRIAKILSRAHQTTLKALGK